MGHAKATLDAIDVVIVLECVRMGLEALDKLSPFPDHISLTDEYFKSQLHEKPSHMDAILDEVHNNGTLFYMIMDYLTPEYDAYYYAVQMQSELAAQLGIEGECSGAPKSKYPFGI